MPTRKRVPTDFTGAKREQLEREHAETLKARQSEMAMAARVATEVSDVVVDYTDGVPLGEEATVTGDGTGEPLSETAEGVQVWETVGAVAPREAEQGDTVVIRVNTDLESVTIGAGNNYEFLEGTPYRVPRHVAAHLEEKGYIYH